MERFRQQPHPQRLVERLIVGKAILLWAPDEARASPAQQLLQLTVVGNECLGGRHEAIILGPDPGLNQKLVPPRGIVSVFSYASEHGKDVFERCLDAHGIGSILLLELQPGARIQLVVGVGFDR